MQPLRDPGVLSDGVIELRPWRDDDVATVCAAGDRSREDALEWIGRQRARPLHVGVSRAIARPMQPAVGYVGLIRRPRLELGAHGGAEDDELLFIAHQLVVGIGYWVKPDAHSQGLATRATRLLSRWALLSAGIARVEALLDPDNAASRRVVEKCGFQPEGRLRRYLELDGRCCDALVYSLLTDDL